MGDTVSVASEKKQGKDSAAGMRAALSYIEGLFSQRMGESAVRIDTKHFTLTVSNGEKRRVIALKTGCSVLGYKDSGDKWSLLPGIDTVLYAVKIIDGQDPASYFRIIEREDFLGMWESLGLIRRKMSVTATRKFRIIFGEEQKPNSNVYADTLAVQSFNNSGRKSVLVDQYLLRFPLLSESDITKI